MPVRCRVGISATRANQSISLGTPTTAMSLLYTEKALEIYTTCPSANASTSWEPVYIYNTIATAGQVGGRVKCTTYCNVVGGGWINALKAQMTFGTSGGTSGLASSLCLEMDLPNATRTAGAFYPLEIELNPGASTVMGGITGARTGFIFMSVNTNVGDFCDKGYIFEIQGVGAAASSHIFQTNTDQATHALRISIDQVAYYLLMTSVNNGTE